MLPTSVAIDSPSSNGGGEYTLNLFFQNTSKAKFLNVGDYIEDSNTNQYEITDIPSVPFSSGNSVTVQFVTTDTLPAQDVDFDSSAFTPGQVDVRPAVLTAVFVTAAAIYDAQNYEHQVQVTVATLLEANKAAVGDSFVDLQGKEYQISFIDPVDRFDVPFRCIEVAKEGQTPSNGDGAIYRATSNIDLYQGTEITDSARTKIRNRDNFLVDAKLKELEDTIASSISANSLVASTYTNSTGSTINPLVAVCTNASGEIKVCDVSVEDDVQAFKGITVESILNTSDGQVAKLGKILDITTAFDHQDSLFVAKDGTITNIPPEIGANGFVAGDFVMYIGHISKNESNPTLKDLELRPQLMGQL